MNFPNLDNEYSDDMKVALYDMVDIISSLESPESMLQALTRVMEVQTQDRDQSFEDGKQEAQYYKGTEEFEKGSEEGYDEGYLDAELEVEARYVEKIKGFKSEIEDLEEQIRVLRARGIYLGDELC